jgi:antitoxin (DNA-binding transcriptional repressor) of toxin-antitoxin stability system
MTVPLSEAQSRLEELIAQLRPGEELVLTDGANRPVARVVGEPPRNVPTPYRDFPSLRHYAAVPVCVATAGIMWAVFGLLGYSEWVGFLSGLLASVILLAGAFAIAQSEAD